MTRLPLNLPFSKAIKPFLQDSVLVARSGGPVLLSPAPWAHTLLKPKLLSLRSRAPCCLTWRHLVFVSSVPQKSKFTRTKRKDGGGQYDKEGMSVLIAGPALRGFYLMPFGGEMAAVSR